MLNEEAVMKVLSGIDDPELRKPLTELDMVKFVKIDGGDVTVGITLTIMGCPLKDKITRDVTEGVGQKLLTGCKDFDRVFCCVNKSRYVH